MMDSEGNCNVENFTIGREGYGNIFFPGVTNVAGLNLDEIVFIRNKEVIVYPDDSKKPEMGKGLNKKAQITLDKVWPVIKCRSDGGGSEGGSSGGSSSRSSETPSPEKLASMKYEEKLRRACDRLGARFVEYRPETGSWVFKVDHFSKYGLDESDEDDEVVVAGGKADVKKLKTLQLREQLPAAKPQPVLTRATVHAEEGKGKAPQVKTPPPKHLDPELSSRKDMPAAPSEPASSYSPPAQQWMSSAAAGNKVQLMKATLFDDEMDDGDDDDDMEVTINTGPAAAKSRPVILEARSTVLEKRDPLIEDIAHSMLTGGAGKGLGGSFSMDQSAGPSSATSNLLRTRFLTNRTLLGTSGGGVMIADGGAKPPSQQQQQRRKTANYSLQDGYEKFVSLPNCPTDDRPKTIVPRHIDRPLPLAASRFAGKLAILADNGLTASRNFRAGWTQGWAVAHLGQPLEDHFLPTGSGAGGGRTFGQVILESVNVSSYGRVDEEQLRSLESWLEVGLENSHCVTDEDLLEELGPRFEAEPGLDTLHAHVQEATAQLARETECEERFGRALRESKVTWDLCLALWGRLRNQDELDRSGPDSHEVTMLRREALSKWLSDVVGPAVREDVRQAKLAGNDLQQVLI